PIEERGDRTKGEGKEGRPDCWILGPAPVRRNNKDKEGQDDGLEVDELPEEAAHRHNRERERAHEGRQGVILAPEKSDEERRAHEMEERWQGARCPRSIASRDAEPAGEQ